jgi:hypothetical protein
LLQTTYPPLNKLGRFSFVREWDADPELSFEVGQKRDGPNAYTGVEVSLKRTPNFLELGNPYFTEWGLVAENGAFVQEISVFTYTCRAVSATSAISTGGGQHE